MNRKRAFTLIELLVVVAIIAVLISILLPAIASARETARRAVCMSNTHQLTLAVNMYADESAGWYPSISAIGTGMYPPCYPWWLDPKSTRSVVPRYVTNPQVFYCPSAQWETWDVGTQARKGEWNSFLQNPKVNNQALFVSYNLVFGSMANVDSPWVRFINYAGDATHPAKNSDGDGTYPVRSNRVNDPTKRVLVSDEFNGYPAWIATSSPFNHLAPNGNFGAGTNQGFVDGHAEWRKPWQITLQLYIASVQEWW